MAKLARRSSLSRLASRSILALAPVAVAGAFMAAPSLAHASVLGKKGIEIEGPMDRRGFMLGMGLNGGAAIFENAVVPGIGVDLTLGGGATKNLTLGVNMNVSKYLTKRDGVAFGGDFEVTGYVYKGLFLRGGLGVAGVPKTRDTYELTHAAGGKVGLGYELWMNTRWAFGVALNYDLRVDGDAQLRHAVILSARFLLF
jgi:hypothetical protein